MKPFNGRSKFLLNLYTHKSYFEQLLLITSWVDFAFEEGKDLGPQVRLEYG